MTVDYTELDVPKGPSPVENWDREGMSAVRVLKCAWEDRYTLLAELGASGGQLYPYYPAGEARAFAAKIEGFGVQSGSGSTADYEYAILTVTYGLNAPYYNGSKYLSEELIPTVDYLPLDASQFRWVSNGVPLQPNEAPAKRWDSFTYILTYYHAAAIPAAALTLPGYCNNGSVSTAVLGITFLTQRLLYNGMRVMRTIQFGTTPTFTIQYRFGYHAAGWNTFWNQQTAAWATIYHVANGSGTPYVNYPLGDFSGLVP